MLSCRNNSPLLLGFLQYMILSAGTLLVEAALVATNTPPGLHRDFAFQLWKTFDQRLWQKVRRQAMKSVKPTKTMFYGSDKNKFVLSAAKRNANAAGFRDNLLFEEKSVQNWEPSGLDYYESALWREIEMRFTYEEFGARLKHHASGSKAWIICSNNRAFNQLGLKFYRRNKVLNGKLPCELRAYSMFSGSLRDQ